MSIIKVRGGGVYIYKFPRNLLVWCPHFTLVWIMWRFFAQKTIPSTRNLGARRANSIPPHFVVWKQPLLAKVPFFKTNKLSGQDGAGQEQKCEGRGGAKRYINGNFIRQKMTYIDFWVNRVFNPIRPGLPELSWVSNTIDLISLPAFRQSVFIIIG